MLEDQLTKLMAQAQKLQMEIAKVQEKMKNLTVEVSVDDGTVRVVATGDQKIKEVIIDPNYIHRANGDLLQSLIVEGVNEALQKAKNMAESEMRKVTGGLTIPNFPGLM